ncbi:MAG: prenyltransferase [Nitrosopumilaceae archaeon]|nr:prenyltransferase [Nitrosopumilaceae archaeon]NDF25604.1 prenyltransferase [Nitrososphaerota archaeon]
MKISIWFRVIRIKFLLASVIAVSLGLSLSYWQTGKLDAVSAIITMGGVMALHASVDLLNDYSDYKRGIDTITKRTKFSGGTGVLPEGLLKPLTVYYAGIIFLVLGSLAGAYFVIIHGWIIAAILGFAILSIYFYSTKIVDSGLGEIFVGIKGTMIVLGTMYIQTEQILPTNILSGIIAGTLSSFVLFITSFPDHDADKEKGRKTLVIALGKIRAANLYWVFPCVAYSLIIFGIVSRLLPVYSAMVFVTIPLAIKSGKKIKQYHDDIERFVGVMKSTVLFSRITGALFVISILIAIAKNS